MSLLPIIFNSPLRTFTNDPVFDEKDLFSSYAKLRKIELIKDKPEDKINESAVT